MVIRLLLAVAAAAFALASLSHAGIWFSGELGPAATAEGIIAIVLAVAAVAAWSWPQRARHIAPAALAFAFLGPCVGAFTIAVGIGPQTQTDHVLHALLLLGLALGLVRLDLSAPRRSGHNFAPTQVTPALPRTCSIFYSPPVVCELMTRPKLVSVAVPKQTPVRRAPIPMNSRRREIEYAIEVFVRGHSAGKSRTFPYEARRMRSLWVMRDAPRQNPRDYRKEEWIAYDVAANKVDAVARCHSRGRFFVGAMVESGASDEATRAAYRCLGYRLLATEGFFVQRLRQIPKVPVPLPIERVRTPELASRLAQATRTRPILSSLLGDRRPIPSVCGAGWAGNRGPGTQRGCGWGHLVHRHARQRGLSAARDRTGAVVPNVARRSRPRREVFGADGEPRGGAAVPARGLRADRNALALRTKEGLGGASTVSSKLRRPRTPAKVL